MTVATFNANSVRARLPIILDWLAEHQPDVLAIQETKCEDSQFPVQDFEESGYNVAFHGQKSYNGVATVSRLPLQDVRYGLLDPEFSKDCRMLAATVDGVRILNTYVPNGNRVGSEKFEYKLKWLERFREYCEQTLRPDQPAIWLGDINIAPTPDDVFDSARHLGGVGHHPDEFAALARVVQWGWTDLFRKFTDGPGHYTYWEFVIPNSFARNLGWRIDHVYATKPMADRCTSCVIDRAPRGLERPSDHTFVVAEFA